uniref:Uncharacterized protein n=1 Tax=Odontella aurita TaxID=265563 RepID=A0A7S4IW18_9STRA|mmetsp:Transcript_31263/g.93685  ORF Transcript_31263/g.93685 Transcript_31263/m.93685 type:complete len:391 (+) Transcript_31263:228-1400(+)
MSCRTAGGGAVVVASATPIVRGRYVGHSSSGGAGGSTFSSSITRRHSDGDEHARNNSKMQRQMQMRLQLRQQRKRQHQYQAVRVDGVSPTSSLLPMIREDSAGTGTNRSLVASRSSHQHQAQVQTRSQVHVHPEQPQQHQQQQRGGKREQPRRRGEGGSKEKGGSGGGDTKSHQKRHSTGSSAAASSSHQQQHPHSRRQHHQHRIPSRIPTVRAFPIDAAAAHGETMVAASMQMPWTMRQMLLVPSSEGDSDAHGLPQLTGEDSSEKHRSSRSYDVKVHRIEVCQPERPQQRGPITADAPMVGQVLGTSCSGAPSTNIAHHSPESGGGGTGTTTTATMVKIVQWRKKLPPGQKLKVRCGTCLKRWSVSSACRTLYCRECGALTPLERRSP